MRKKWRRTRKEGRCSRAQRIKCLRLELWLWLWLLSIRTREGMGKGFAVMHGAECLYYHLLPLLLLEVMGGE